MGRVPSVQKTGQEPANRPVIGIAFAVAAALATLGLGLRFAGGGVELLAGLRALALIGLFTTEAVRRLLLDGVAAERAERLSIGLGVCWLVLFLLDIL